MTHPTREPSDTDVGHISKPKPGSNEATLTETAPKSEGNMTNTPSKQARELCAKLIPHTTSVHNVTLVQEALDSATQTNVVLAKRLKAQDERMITERDAMISSLTEAIHGLLNESRNMSPNIIQTDEYRFARKTWYAAKSHMEEKHHTQPTRPQIERLTGV